MRERNVTERPGDAGRATAARRWQSELDQAGKAEAPWRAEARRVLARYRDDGEGRRARFNVLFSNTRTLAPALYADLPRPDVRRRHRDADPTARRAAEVLGRALNHAADAHDMDAELRAAIQDCLLTGRGVVRVRYAVRMAMARRRMPVCVTYSDASGSRDDGERRGGKPTFYRPDTMAEAEPSFDALGPYVDGDEYEEVAAESTTCEHVHWDDFRLSPARSWDEVRWVAFRTRLSREELVGRFGPKIGGAVPLDETTAPEGEVHAGDSDAPRRAEVWEIWDKPRREVVFLATGAKSALLDAVEDPLGLADFFPVPRPLYSVPATDSLTPYPEFLVYEDQARELDEVTRRIMALTKALKLRGIYDSAQPEIARLLTADDNQMIPSEHFMSMIERGGLDKAVQFAPVGVGGIVVARYRWDRARGRLVQVGPAVVGRAPGAPSIRRDQPGYVSPVTGRWIDGRAARREDLAASGCREVDPSEKPA